MNQYIRPQQYAKLCGVSASAIYQRISNKTLDTVNLASPDGKLYPYIDTHANPPEKREPGKKSKIILDK